MLKLRPKINDVMKYLDLRIVKARQYEELLEKLSTISNANRINGLLARFNHDLINSFEYPKLTSQLGQELFVLSMLNLKKNGYFVEFGATDGISLSNTYVLEKEYGWRGILAEPAKKWHSALVSNRTSEIDFRAIYSKSTRAEFKEVTIPELSTLSGWESNDHHANLRSIGSYYEVETIRLPELLKQHNSPREIDYMSIDTEGSELEILREFNFSEYEVKVFTIEHNYSKNRNEIQKLMAQNGYKHLFSDISKFDDWFVMESLAENSN